MIIPGNSLQSVSRSVTAVSINGLRDESKENILLPVHVISQVSFDI